MSCWRGNNTWLAFQLQLAMYGGDLLEDAKLFDEMGQSWRGMLTEVGQLNIQALDIGNIWPELDRNNTIYVKIYLLYH